MIALIRYLVAAMLHSQRHYGPVLLFAGLLGSLSANDSGPLPSAYASSAAALFVAAVWFTAALISTQDPVQRAITTVAAGSARKILLATVAVAALTCVLLAMAGLAVPLVTGDHVVTGTDLLVGAEAEIACGAAGIAIGLVCSRLVIRRLGYALASAIALMFIVLLAPGLPPVNALLRRMGAARESAQLVTPLGVYCLVALALLTVSVGFTHIVATRRD